jgi:hypothetical protein
MNPEPVYAKCRCQHCDGLTEFDATGAGQTVPCPHCGLDTILFIPPPPPPPAPAKEWFQRVGKGLGAGISKGWQAARAEGERWRAERAWQNRYGSAKYCTQCGCLGPPKSKVQGTFLLELFLWCCFCFPGFLYTLWRITNQVKVCRECGSASLIPPTSPRAQQLMNR